MIRNIFATNYNIHQARIEPKTNLACPRDILTARANISQLFTRTFRKSNESLKLNELTLYNRAKPFSTRAIVVRLDYILALSNIFATSISAR